MYTNAIDFGIMILSDASLLNVLKIIEISGEAFNSFPITIAASQV
jgi:hypothetical protein